MQEFRDLGGGLGGIFLEKMGEETLVLRLQGVLPGGRSMVSGLLLRVHGESLHAELGSHLCWFACLFASDVAIDNMKFRHKNVNKQGKRILHSHK